MYCVYLIKSINFPEIVYVGYTINLEQRLKTHNSGGSIHTAKYRPWQLVMYLTFFDEAKANGFDVKTMKQIIKLRKLDKNKLAEQDAILELYRQALEV